MDIKDVLSLDGFNENQIDIAIKILDNLGEGNTNGENLVSKIKGVPRRTSFYVLDKLVNHGYVYHWTIRGYSISSNAYRRHRLSAKTLRRLI